LLSVNEKLPDVTIPILVSLPNTSKRVARKGNEVFGNDTKIGIVTSGNFSLTLNKAIGFCFVPAELSQGEEIKIYIGEKFYDSRLTSTRFYKR